MVPGILPIQNGNLSPKGSTWLSHCGTNMSRGGCEAQAWANYPVRLASCGKMYLGITRVGSLSVADTELEEPSTNGRHVDNRVDSLISRIRPARHSEARRHRVAQYVSDLIARCFQADHEVQICGHLSLCNT